MEWGQVLSPKWLHLKVYSVLSRINIKSEVAEDCTIVGVLGSIPLS